MILATLVLLSFLRADYIGDNVIEKISKRYGPFAARRVMALNEMLANAKNLNEFKKLEVVNDFFNEVKYESDMKVWGKRDYWATPLEFLIKDRGDCEDYVIAKYFALKYLGVDPKKLYFVYAKVIGRKVPHMVLAYYKTPSSEPLILDSLNYKIFPVGKRKDLIPVYLFNGDILERFKNKKRDHLESKNKKVKLKWDDLMSRIKRNVL